MSSSESRRSHRPVNSLYSRDRRFW